MSARSTMTTQRTRALTVLALCLATTLAGCGGPPAPIEVSEPWTSGDERALGIEEPAAEEPAMTGASSPAGASSADSD